MSIIIETVVSLLALCADVYFLLRTQNLMKYAGREMRIEDMTNSDIANAIDEYVRGERNRAILKRRLIDLICYEPLAEEFNLSVPQIKRIIYKSQEQLFKHI